MDAKPEPHETSNSKLKKRRTPKKSNNNRNYFCGCGKAYLSYPALYTHVRIKHEGVFPIGSSAKKKVPKSADTDCEHAYVPDMDRFLDDFDEFVAQVDAAPEDGKRELREDDVTRLFGFIETGYSVDAESFENHMLQMLHMGLDEAKFNRVKTSLSVYQIICCYILAIHPRCNAHLFNEYFYLLFMLVQALNHKGELFLNKSTKPRLGLLHDCKSFCDTREVYVVADILNLFIVEMFPVYFKPLQEKCGLDFRYLGYEDDCIKNLVHMCRHLASWLFNAELVDFRLEFNVDG